MHSRIPTIKRIVHSMRKTIALYSYYFIFDCFFLKAKHADHLTRKFHIYMLKNGRINMCSINPKNCDYVAEAIHDAVTSAEASL